VAGGGWWKRHLTPASRCCVRPAPAQLPPAAALHRLAGWRRQQHPRMPRQPPPCISQTQITYYLLSHSFRACCRRLCSSFVASRCPHPLFPPLVQRPLPTPAFTPAAATEGAAAPSCSSSRGSCIVPANGPQG
jgi:hypothetical protein